MVDLISDIGGLTSSCLVIFKILLLLIKYRDLEWYLVSKLFKAKELIAELSSDSDMHSDNSDTGPAFARRDRRRTTVKKPPKSLGNLQLKRS